MRLSIINIALSVFLLILFSCSDYTDPQWKAEPTEPIDIKIHRYGKELFLLDTGNFSDALHRLQPRYTAFLGKEALTTPQIEQLFSFVTDRRLLGLNRKVGELFPDLTSLEGELNEAFSRYWYFFPTTRTPEVYTYISGIHYEAPIEKNDSILIIGLDNYLGQDFEVYQYLGLPRYRVRKMSGEYLLTDVFTTIYNVDIKPSFKPRNLLDRMIDEGKELIFLDAILPQVPDTIKLGITGKQMEWMKENKANIWAYLVSNNLFYSTDFKIQSQLIQDGPFTTDFGTNSAPKTGVWLGWEIIKAYHGKHPEVSLSTLIDKMDAQTILQKSGYKP